MPDGRYRLARALLVCGALAGAAGCGTLTAPPAPRTPPPLPAAVPIQTPPPETAAPDALYTHGMRYYSGRDPQPRLVGAIALNLLYEEALPDYGVYVFVLSGTAARPPDAAQQRRHRELLRVIETYVAAPPSAVDPERSVAFLIPVSLTGPEAADPRLSDELAELMRRTLTQALRERGERHLTGRLTRRPGPFLVASPEPRLVPLDPAAPRLIADLSGLGPEYLYGVIDAFDRPLPAAQHGQPASLEAIRARLSVLPAPPEAWVFEIGRSDA